MAVHSLGDLGSLVRAFREHRGLTQEQLSKDAGRLPRTAIAHLEQGYRLPAAEHLRALAKHLSLPDALVEPFLRLSAARRVEFEAELGELIGQEVSIAHLDDQASQAVEGAVTSLIGAAITNHAAFDTLREIQVFYGIRPVSQQFFNRYFKADSFQDIGQFSAAVKRYQAEAIRLFPTFMQAYEEMNRASDLATLVAALGTRSLDEYRDRAPWNRIENIDEARLRDLGYIAAAKLDQERKEREELVKWLRDMAAFIRQNGRTSVEEFKPKRRREMESLLRKFGSRLSHGPMSALFSPAPEELEAEAERLAPKDEIDRARIAGTQATGLRNLSQYLAADHMDVYVATSMREDSDFVSVNQFVLRLFEHPEVKPLKLRYFNPTQSWVEDRIAKGLVEALMLRRSAATIYMAQKSDTFGKDSEASVALGQGKPVIVYVPKLDAPELQLDSSELAQSSEDDLRNILHRIDPDEVSQTMDREAMLGAILNRRLAAGTDEQIADVVARHWADFGLDTETDRFKETRGKYLEWLRGVMSNPNAPPPIPEGLRADIDGTLVATAVRFERRASLFREKHPLALQVILSTGVLNGILVARSVDSCATLLRKVFENNLDLELVRGEDSYRLIERTTQSTIRVISKHHLLANAFASYYASHAP
ncbi:helix-turn-helix domain-containing protein [Polyangium mundeleinium]|uniref:Helix-turn-helix transcriptional regulator n=1 Tax=Polyangium mundeleinium TaxID=2995306 RepID=A0ABT5EJH8_9BACT|nr:helix-turn-helix transcriptional regulator [Polyangium mundeleinium]MDC0740891.1 helix-turn-helix transcriptional regulator [Polyangium mundeleinium]